MENETPDGDQPNDDPTLRESLAVRLRDFASVMYTTQGVSSDVQEAVEKVLKITDQVTRLENQVDKLKKEVTVLKVASKILGKLGPTKSAAETIKGITKTLEDRIESLEEKIEELKPTMGRFNKFLRKADDALDKVIKASEVAAITADVYSQKFASADQDLARAESQFSLDLPFLEEDDDDGLQDALKLQIAKAAAENNGRIGQNGDLTDAKEFLDNIAEGLSDLTDDFDSKPLEALTTVIGWVKSLTDAIGSVTDYIQPAVDKAGPVIDALGSIFGWILKPLEAAFEWVLDKLGINDALRSFAESILPDLPSIGILDDLKDTVENFITQAEAIIDEQILAPIEAITSDYLNNDNFLSSLSQGTSGSDFLQGAFNTANSGLTVDGLAGDDVIYGGQFDDTLLGGAGRDVLIGGRGDDILDGGDDAQDSADMVVYSGPREAYGLTAIVENGTATGDWVVWDKRESIVDNGKVVDGNEGTDRLQNIELILFSDDGLDLRKFDQYIETESIFRDVVYVSPTATTLENSPPAPGLPNGAPRITTDVPSPDDPERGNRDWVFGAEGLDILLTGGGNDQLSSGDNPASDDPFSFQGDLLLGGLGNDVYNIAPGGASLDHIDDEGGIDTVNYEASTAGVNVFLGSTDDADRESFYIPPSVIFDATEDGNGENQLVIVDANQIEYSVGEVPSPAYIKSWKSGVIRGIENIEGSEFADILIGNDDVNKISGKGGNDQIRGLDGSDLLLGGAGNDILIGDGGDDHLDGGTGINNYVGGLGNDLIDDILGENGTVKYADLESNPIDFVDYENTGFGINSQYDLPQSIVVVNTGLPGEQQVSKYISDVVTGNLEGVDLLESIENIVATNGGDIIHTSPDIDQKIYAGGGDDVVRTEANSPNTDSAYDHVIYGGTGNDQLFSDNQSRDLFVGGEGNDTVQIWGDRTVDYDGFLGGSGTTAFVDDLDVLDFSQSDFSWHIFQEPEGRGRDSFFEGFIIGYFPTTSFVVENPLYIQPTAGVNGIIAKPEGVERDENLHQGVSKFLTETVTEREIIAARPGGRSFQIDEWEHIIGSSHRDIIVGGSYETDFAFEGREGNDVLYAAQINSATLSGGDGDDVLGSYNQTFETDTPVSLWAMNAQITMIGGDGDDDLVAGDYREIFDGGEGEDLLSFEASISGIQINLSTNFLTGGYATGDILAGGIEDVIGTQFDDVIFGDSERNELIGWDGDDIIHGFEGADNLFGNAGNDLIYGGLGNDILHGGTGRDLLDGGEGIDTASWNQNEVHAKGGILRLITEVVDVVADLETGTANEEILYNIENLQGGDGDDDLRGDDGENFIGGGDGDDFIDGRENNDVLSGGDGNDEIRGGLGDDVVTGGDGDNVLDGGEGYDALDYGVLEIGVEIIMAGVGVRAGQSTGQVRHYSPEFEFVWTDSLDTETLSGFVEDSTVETGTSESRFTYEVLDDQGNDDPSDDITAQRTPITPKEVFDFTTPLFADAPNIPDDIPFLPEFLTPEQEVTRIETFSISTDTFEGFEQIIGSQGADLIRGNAEDTWFFGGSGADDIDGGDGIDTISFDFREAEFGVTVDMKTQANTGGHAQGDIIVNVENIVGTKFNDNLAGNDDDNIIEVKGGSNSARGYDGIDTVVLDYDFFDVDLIQLMEDGINLTRLVDGQAFSIDFIADDVEFLQFNDTTRAFSELFDAANTGTPDPDVLIGTEFVDYLDGRESNDIVIGLENDDLLLGGDDNDLLNGGPGADTLEGGLGRDVVAGGPGDDTFNISNLEDIVLELFDEGTDTVQTSVDYTLPENVENLTVTGTEGVEGVGNVLGNVLIGGDGDDTLKGRDGPDDLTGGGGTNYLLGGPGDDTYRVNSNTDLVVEAFAEDGFDKVYSSVDYVLPRNVELAAVVGNTGVRITGNDEVNEFHTGVSLLEVTGDPFDGLGDNTFDGRGGEDILILGHDFEGSEFGFDDEGYLTISIDGFTNRAKSIEKFDFTDQFFLLNDLLDAAFPRIGAFDPTSGVTLTPGINGLVNGIDMSDASNGAQFVHVEEIGPQSNSNTSYSFSTAGGEGNYLGSGFDDPASGPVQTITLEESGAAGSLAFISSGNRPIGELIEGSWAYFQNVLFAFNDDIAGTELDDILRGFDGDDSVSGNEGDDAVNGDDGDDTLIGNAGNDTIDGGNGNDSVEGGSGQDHLFGGAGDDTHTGGSGRDVFVVHLGMDADTVTDFEIGIDELDINSLTPDQRDALTFNVVSGDLVIGVEDGGTLTLTGIDVPDLPLLELSPADFDGVNGFQANIEVTGENVAVSDVGDINNDGIDDFAVGWAQSGFPATLAPITYIVYGKDGEPFDPVTDVYLLGQDEGFSILAADPSRSISISAAGDFNNDGIDDVIVGDRDVAHIVFGQDGNLDNIGLDQLGASEGVQINLGNASHPYPKFVAGGFDLNGDGIDDVAIGANYTESFNSSGETFIIFGQSGQTPAEIDREDLDGTNGIILTGRAGFTQSGISVASAGDVNGDGFDDIIIGAQYLRSYDPDNPGVYASSEATGGAYVLFGSDQGFAANIDLSALTQAEGFEIEGDFATGQDRTGRTVEGGGDVNGDGIDDIVISAGRSTTKGTDNANLPGDLIERAYVVFGKEGGFDAPVKLADLDGSDGTVFTFALRDGFRRPFDPSDNSFQPGFAYAIGATVVDIVDDLNNDRFDDIVLTVNDLYVENLDDPDTGEDISNTATWESATYVLYGTETGWGDIFELEDFSSSDGFVVNSDANDRMGVDLAQAGDVNNDGGNDIIIGRGAAPSLVLFGDPITNFASTGAPVIEGDPTEGQLLTANPVGIDDPDGIKGDFSFQWLRDGVEINENAQEQTYLVTADDVGSDLTVRVLFVDGLGQVISTTSAPVGPVEQLNVDPDALPDFVDVPTGESTLIAPLANDRDLNGDRLIYSANTDPSNGTLVVNPDGSVLYTPNDGFTGIDNFSYRATDGLGGASEVTTVIVGVETRDDAPIVPDQTFILAEDSEITIRPLDAGSDPDGDDFRIVGVHVGVEAGLASVEDENLPKVEVSFTDETLTIAGLPDAFGDETLELFVEDEFGNRTQAEINLTITPEPDAPTAVDDVIAGPEDYTLTIDVLANDIDPDGQDTLSLAQIGGNSGTLFTAFINADEHIEIVPLQNQFGSDTLFYIVEDDTGQQSTGELTVYIDQFDDPAIAVDDAVTVNEDVAIEFNLLDNDLDFFEQDLSLATVEATAQFAGTLEDLGGGLIRVTPDANFNGVLEGSYTLSDGDGNTSIAGWTVNVLPITDAPVAQDDLLFVQQDNPRTFDPRVSDASNPDGEDSDVDGDPFTIVSETNGANGTVMVAADGSEVTYAPAPGYIGSDTFTYTIRDTSGLEDTATVDVTVARNDRPVAVADTYTVAEDSSITIDLVGPDSPLNNDTDAEGDAFLFDSIETGVNGSVLYDLGNETFTYTPNANLNGDALDVVEYTIRDSFDRLVTSTITFDVTQVNDPTTGDLAISTSFDSWSNPEFTVDVSQLGDVDGLQPWEYFDGWIWRVDGQIETGIDDRFFPYVEHTQRFLTVEGTYTDQAGNLNFVQSNAVQIPYVYPVSVFDVDPTLDEVIDPFGDGFGPNGESPGNSEINGFKLGRDQIDLQGSTAREDALNAIRTAEDGSAILTFDNGSVLRIEGDGVSASTITFDDFLLQDGNVEPTGDVVIIGSTDEGQILTADVSGVDDIEGIVAGSQTYQWQRDGVDIPGATGATHLVDPADVGSTIRVIYGYEDDFGTVESVTSAEIGPVTAGGELIFGTFEAETLNGTAGSDTIIALEGDDVINPGRGDDALAGGPGIDRVTFSGDQSSYTISIGQFTSLITDRRPGGDGTDDIQTIELLDFATELPLFGGQPMRFDFFDGPGQLTEEEFAPIIELYIAYFNRAPDALGLYFWATAYTNGTTLEQMASLFVGQPETQIEYPPGTSNTIFAETVYTNVLGRTPDAGGFNFWVGLLDDGIVARDAFILEVLRGAKADPSPGQTQEFIDQQIADRAYLETKTDIGAYFSVLKGMSEVNAAKSVMSLFDGTADSVTATVNAIDDVYEDALDPIDGQFLMPLLFGYEDPFAP